jgi:hypothetical protein
LIENFGELRFNENPCRLKAFGAGEEDRPRGDAVRARIEKRGAEDSTMDQSASYELGPGVDERVGTERRAERLKRGCG